MPPKIDSISVKQFGLQQGEIPGAREAYERALATFERFLGPDHLHTRGVQQYLDSLVKESEGKA